MRVRRLEYVCCDVQEPSVHVVLVSPGMELVQNISGKVVKKNIIPCRCSFQGIDGRVGNDDYAVAPHQRPKLQSSIGKHIPHVAYRVLKLALCYLGSENVFYPCKRERSLMIWDGISQIATRLRETEDMEIKRQSQD